MKNNLFDEHIKAQMAGLKPDVGAHIWDNIAKKMEEKKPRAFWSVKRIATFLPLLLIAAGALVYFVNNSSTKNNNGIVQNTQSVKEEKKIIANQTNTITGNNEDKNNIAKTATIENNDISITKNIEPNKVDNDLLNNNKNPNISSPKNKISKAKKTASIKTNILDNHLKTFATNNERLNKKQSTTTIKNSNKKTTQLINNESVDDEKITNFSTNKKSRKNIINSEKLLSKENITSQKLTATSTSQQYFNIQSVAADFLSSKNLFTPTIVGKKFLIIPCPEIEKNIAGKKTYLDLYGGPDYIFRTFSDTGKIYLEQRKASTGIQYAYSAGLRYTKVFGSGMSIRTGLNYSQMNEHLVAFNGYILERVIRINSTGDTTANFTQSNIQYKKTMNVYRSIDIPIQIGYEMGNGKLHTNISLGAMLNIASKQIGSVLDNKGNPVNITSGQSNNIYQYKNNMGVSFLGSVAFYYKLNDRWHVMAEPYIRYSLSPYTKPTITFKQKFNAAGLRFGIRRDF